MARNKSAATPKAKVVEFTKVDSKPEENEQGVPIAEEKKEEDVLPTNNSDLDTELKKLEVAPPTVEEIDTTTLDDSTATLVEEIDADPILNWKKLGGGSFELNGHYIKPNQKFQARASQIPRVFRDVVALLDTIQPGQVVTKHIAVVYTLEPLENGMFNIIDSYKKKINEEPLDKDTALSFISSLSL